VFNIFKLFKKKPAKNKKIKPIKVSPDVDPYQCYIMSLTFNMNITAIGQVNDDGSFTVDVGHSKKYRVSEKDVLAKNFDQFNHLMKPS